MGNTKFLKESPGAAWQLGRGTGKKLEHNIPQRHLKGAILLKNNTQINEVFKNRCV